MAVGTGSPFTVAWAAWSTMRTQGAPSSAPARMSAPPADAAGSAKASLPSATSTLSPVFPRIHKLAVATSCVHDIRR